MFRSLSVAQVAEAAHVLACPSPAEWNDFTLEETLSLLPLWQAYSPSPILINTLPPIKAGAADSKHRYDGCAISDFTSGPILGTGSFGRVFLAHHRQTGNICAIKALSKAHLVKNQQARVERWARCCAVGPSVKLQAKELA